MGERKLRVKYRSATIRSLGFEKCGPHLQDCFGIEETPVILGPFPAIVLPAL